MTRSIMSPAKYIQGRGEIRRLHRYCTELEGKNAYIVADAFVLANYEKEISEGFQGCDVSYVLQSFAGECSRKEVQRIVEAAKESEADVIIGIGGGKTLDAAKAVGFYSRLRLIVAPTVASTDAPCSALSVLYTEDGRLDKYLPLRSNPERVVVDTELVAKAPVRLLVAGMGDALSTFYEARACRRAAKSGGRDTSAIAAYTLARACRDTLLADGAQAKQDAENGILSEAVENIIEANIYLSGIGFESGGLAAAHAIHNAMTQLEETRPILHGEKVAFGTLVHLVLEKADPTEIEEALAFCRSVGLPTTLRQLNLDAEEQSKLRLVAEASCAPHEPMSNMPFKVKPEDVLAAILEADRLGANSLTS
ncbi:glycerol dehydrogenase [Paenibacillus sophorae]|uniref:Glycerol dehydrogenase n=1 Tax=Paenibacillus sophorae TaxID=1333845 RepID=A0A1H8I259_9BACL|nr:glycerol dehydrogenase [Paenibacillus sophorae]QWU15816.1 glycerol dehydrogenase [Paenibacillus sophorae]SEN61998.1 glycerol dehydrogenase [Paenibacillus sophorae]